MRAEKADDVSESLRPGLVLFGQARLVLVCVICALLLVFLPRYASLFPHEIEVAKGFGWEIPEGSKINFQDFQRRKRKELQRLNGIYSRILTNVDVEVHEGRGSLVDNHTVQIGSKTVTAKYIVIATGGRAFVPDIPGRELVVTSGWLGGRAGGGLHVLSRARKQTAQQNLLFFSFSLFLIV